MRILESVGSGCGFLDFDGDGHLDALLVGTPRCALFRNQGDGTFADVTRQACLGAEGTWVGCATGDYDNDGDADLFITGYRACCLYQNQGNGTFRDVTRSAGIRMTPWSTAAAFVDLDRDGWLDLYIGAYANFGPRTKQYCFLRNNEIKTSCRPFDYDPIVGQCYRNLQNGTFEDATRPWGLNKAHGRNLGVAAADFDRDGWPDLYLANDELEADLFRNERGRGFRNVAATTGTAYAPDGRVMGGMGIDWGDYDNDGWLDLLVGSYEAEDKPLFRNVEGHSFETSPGTSRVLAASYMSVVWGSLLFDYDNDGWLDLMYVNGHVYDNMEQLVHTSKFKQACALYHNEGRGTFRPVVSQALAIPIAGRGLACGDYDNDGDLDLLVVDIDGPARLLRNEASKERLWIQVAARGTRSNRDAIGALVTVRTAGLTQSAEVRTSRSYASSCDPRVSFGLGAAATVGSIEVRWPSGGLSRVRDVPADRVVTITEGNDEPVAKRAAR